MGWVGEYKLKLEKDKEVVGWQDVTGPIGDTFGGILSPLIGLVSIYFIYETFKAQREQLEEQKTSSKAAYNLQSEEFEDQKKANDATISSNRLHSLMDDFERVRIKFENIEYTTFMVFKGISAFQNFVTKNNEELFKYVDKNDLEFLKNTDNILTEIKFLATLVKDDRILTEFDMQLLRYRFQDLVGPLLTFIQLAHNVVYLNIENTLFPDAVKYVSVNRIVKYYANYMQTIKSLDEVSILRIEDEGTIMKDSGVEKDFIGWKNLKDVDIELVKSLRLLNYKMVDAP